MKKLICLTMIIGIATFMTSCGSGTNSPSAAAGEIVELIQDGDYGKIVDHLYFESSEGEDVEAQKEMLAAILEEKAGKSIEQQGGLKDYEILEEEIAEDGNSATVRVKYYYEDGTEDTQNMDFVNVDGEWLLTLNK
jgi:hypothetical protein